MLDCFFNPKSLAVIGASSNETRADTASLKMSWLDFAEKFIRLIKVTPKY